MTAARVSPPRALSPIRPTLAEVLALLGLILVSALGTAMPDNRYLAEFNIALNLGFGLVLFAGAGHMLRANSFALMTALFWFRLATAVYYAFGSAFVSFTSSDVLAYVRSFYPFTMTEVAAFNQLAIGCTAVVMVTLFVLEPRRAPQDLMRPTDNGGDRSVLAAGLVFLIVGGLAHFLFVLPYQLDLTQTPYSSIIGNLSRMRLLGIFLLTYWAAKTKSPAFVLIVLYVLLEMVLGFFTFAKSAVLMVQIVFFMPLIMLRPSFVRVGLAAIVLAGTFFSIQSVLGELRVNYAEVGASSFKARLAVIDVVLFSDASLEEKQTVLGSMARFSLVNAGTLVMDQYDRGHVSDWPRLIPAVAIPRALWPEKPIITQIGVDIYALGTFGRDTSSVSAGYFAEAYWAGGWPLAIALSVFLGLVLRMLSRFTLRVFHYGRWLQMLTVLLAMRIGFRVDGHYIADVFGALVFVGFFWGFWSVVEHALQSFSRRSGQAYVRPHA